MQPINQRLADGWVLQPATAAAATVGRVDGISATAEFLDAPGGRLFAARNEPSGTPHSSLVICSPLLAEAIRNQRRELVLSWELSALGWSVQRFHYHGFGHSEGEPERMTFQGLVENALTAARHLQERSGTDMTGFMGSRLGALVAAQAAAQSPGSPLVLWEPPIDLGRYYDEVFRARMIGLLKSGRRGPGGKELMETFEAEGYLDVVGNPIAHSLYQTTIGLDLADLIIAAGPRPVLIVQMSVKPEIRPGLATLLDKCQAAGVDVEATVVTHNEAWWFGASAVLEAAAGGLDAIPATTEFLAKVRP